MRGLSNMSFNVRPWSRQWHIFWLSKPFGLDTTALESIVLSIMTNLKFCTCVRLFSLSFYYLHTIIPSIVASPKPNWSILPVLSDLVEWYLWFRKSFNRIVRRETRKRGMPHERINKKTSITYFQWEISTNHKWEQGLPLCHRLVHISFHRSLSLGTSFCRTSCARCLVKQPNTTTWVKQTGCVGGFDMQPKWNKCFNVLGSNWRKQMTGPCSVIPCHSSASILREGLASTTGIVWATILKNVRRLFCFWSALMLTHAGPRVVCGGFSNQSKCQRVQNTSSKARKLQEDPRLFTTRACSGDSIWHSLNKVSFLNALK